MPFQWDEDGTFATVPDGDRGRRLPTQANLDALSGSAFNGGTITDELVIEPTVPGNTFTVKDSTGFVVLQTGDGDNLPVLVRGSGTPAEGSIIFSVEDTNFNEVFTVHSDGFTTMDFAAPNALPDGALWIQVDQATHGLRPFAVKDASLNKAVFSVTPAGHPVTRANAAPADGDLVANEVAMWFDSTNGAAKVMFKGKTADGTVVTGNVALT